MLGLAERQEVAIDPEAAAALAAMSRRNPGCANQLLARVSNYVQGQERDFITLADAKLVIEREGFYPLGLTNFDVMALEILADRGGRGCGQAELSKALGVSQSTFIGILEPYLRLLGLLETLARRVITPKGLLYLYDIKKIGLRPDVRAALLALRGVTT
jgi:Holliday junction resolvasome RuvABC ATP-dependent DNA helicase subunit